MRRRDSTNWFATFPGVLGDGRRPVLGQVFEQADRDWEPNAHVSVPHWFSHLLPEGRLRSAVAHAAGVSERTEFEMLRLLGYDDLPGAIRIIPWDEQSSPDAPVPVAEEVRESDDPVLKFSLAGLQMKFSIHEGERGLTVPVHGQPGNLILKLPDTREGHEFVPETEYATMQFAQLVGIDAATTRLVDAGNVQGLDAWAIPGKLSLAVDRFDRAEGDRRVHAEEFAQLFGISATRERIKYQYTNFEAIANVSAEFGGISSVGRVIDRIVFNVLVGNGDAHLKNWGLVYPDGRNSALGPAYDLVPTVLYVKNDDLGLNLNGTKNFAEVTADSFARLGEGRDWCRRRSEPCVRHDSKSSGVVGSLRRTAPCIDGLPTQRTIE